MRPASLVFKAWTQPEHWPWWGPQGFTIRPCEMDVRPGGGWRLLHALARGHPGTKRGVYREIVEPERLVFTYADVDAAGQAGPRNAGDRELRRAGRQDQAHPASDRLRTRSRSRDAHEGGWTSCMQRFADYLAAV